MNLAFSRTFLQGQSIRAGKLCGLIDMRKHIFIRKTEDLIHAIRSSQKCARSSKLFALLSRL
jgi:hypothetical protein